MKIPKHDADPGLLDRCQITGSKNLFQAIDLGHQPPCDALLTPKTINEPEIYYPLRLMICPDSGSAQLDYIIPGDIVYPATYPYRSGISKPLQDYLHSFAADIVEKFSLPKASLCVDVGCNDGALLSGFKRLGMKTVGVEPTDMARYARKENKIETIQKFFTEDVARDIVSDQGKAKVVTMTNVFAHMAPLGEVMRGLDRLLDKDGIFISESQYLLDVMEGNQFDQVYHEHIRIYSLKALTMLFPYYGMEVFDVDRVPSREGSIRVYVARKGMRPIAPAVGKLLALEEKKKLFSPKTWEAFRERVIHERERFIDLAYMAKRKGLRFVADSCPGRGAVLVNYYGIDKSLMPYIAQLPASEKVGKYLPGTHIPIVANSIIMKEKPEYVVILAWHYAPYIIKNWRAKGLKSKFVIPLPELKIIS